MIHCQKCKTQNLPDQVTCDHCGAELLPAKGFGSRLGSFLLGIIVTLITLIPVYFIFRAETPHPILKWIGYFFIALAFLFLSYFTLEAVRKTNIHERYAIRAKRHLKLDAQQALADFTKALELAPKTEHIPLLKERAAIYKTLGLKDELVSDWDAILDLVPAKERIQTLRKRAVVYESEGIEQTFKSPREQALTRLDPDKRTSITCKLMLSQDVAIPQHRCVYCASKIENKSQAFISEKRVWDKGYITFNFPLCSECDEARNSEVNSAVTLSQFKEPSLFSQGSVTMNFLNPEYAKIFLHSNS